MKSLKILFLTFILASIVACEVHFDGTAYYEPHLRADTSESQETYGGILVDQNGSQLVHKYPSKSISIKDAYFYEEITWQLTKPDDPSGETRAFWFWLPGNRNICGGSTSATCTLDTTFFTDLPSDSKIFSGNTRFNLIAIDRPARCIPPSTLRDILATIYSNGDTNLTVDTGVRLCQDHVYTGLKGPFDEPARFKTIYAEPGVRIKDSYLEGNLVIFSKGNRVTLDNARIIARKGSRFVSIRGLNMENDSSLDLSAKPEVPRSFELADVTIRDSSRLALSVGYSRKLNADQANSGSITLKNFKALNETLGPPAALVINVSEGKLIIQNSIIKSAMQIANSTWYGGSVEINGSNVDIESPWCALNNGIAPEKVLDTGQCTSNNVIDYFSQQ